jgi:4-diphosphocytidyl-2-C-methyl-D-erythritol kinase
LKYNELAFAKTNLFLTVGPKDKNTNRHLLESVYVRLSLADIVEVEINSLKNPARSNSIKISTSFSSSLERHLISSGKNPVEFKNYLDSESNIIFKTIKFFFEKIKLNNSFYEVNVKLIKEIPFEAGLGGGSSDAATMLLILGKEFNISFYELSLIAPLLGADVLPCMLKSPTLELAEPKRIIKLNNNNKLSQLIVLVAKPPEVSSTKEAFLNLNRLPKRENFTRDDKSTQALINLSEYFKFNTDLFPLLNKSKNLLEAHNLVLNDFEENIFHKIPSLKKAKEFFLSKGCITSFLSGSGSALVSIFDNSTSIGLVKDAFLDSFENSWYLNECNFI